MVFLNRNPSARKNHAPVPIVEGNPGLPPSEDHRSTMLAVLADAGCALRTPSGPPLPPSDPYKLRQKLEARFSACPNLLEDFLSGFSSYIDDSENLKSVLIPAPCGADLSSSRTESLARMLLLVPQVQLQLQRMLLEKLPEHFGCDETASMAMEDDVARLIIHHFRWLDFLVDCRAFVEKLLEVLTICPIQLKKDIIGSLPEIIGDQSGETVVSALERMLQEDSEVVVPVLDSFSNLNLDDRMQEQVVTIALSCIRTIDAEHMPFLLRFLLLSATPVNAGRIIAQIREHLIFTSMLDPRAARNKKLKGKSVADNAEASILEALRSSIRFKNILCEAILKELKTVNKPRDHKVIDVWLIMLIHANGGSLQKNAEKIIKKKIADGSFSESLFDQCIRGHRVLAQVYFTSFLSLCEYLVACREKQPRDFGIYMYTCLFEEFVDTYSRQEVLGALVTHIGSGVGHEVNAALETMVLLTSKHSKDMLPLSSYISGVLDFLEGFESTNLHKVYEIFSRLALSAQSSDYSVGSSIANELPLIVRKQINNQDLKYKRMGIIGTLKLVAFLGDTKFEAHVSSSQKTNSEEALELLNMSLDSCKFLPLALILFYDELVALLESITLRPSIMEWMCKHAGEFESKFLSDLEGGQLSKKESYGGLEGELWMNLDGDLSPICLSILPLLSSSLELSVSSLQVLPANFQLLYVVERLTNQGSLGGIDALLGCPLHLPSLKYFVGSIWKSLTGKQKQIVSLSLYYAINWLRELLNAFSSQVAGKVHCISQNTREEMIAKLLKRLKNLVFLEGLLNISLKCSPQSLPNVHLIMEHSDSPLLSKLNHRRPTGIQTKDGKSSEHGLQKNKRKHRASSLASEKLETNGKQRQPTILDVLKRAGVVSQEVANEVSSGFSCKEKALQSDTIAFNEKGLIEISAVAMFLEGQKFKFRPLVVDCLFILSFLEGGSSCSSDTAAELPIHLYLLCDFHYKLDYLTPPSKQSPVACTMTCKPPADLGKMTTSEFLHKIKPIFPSLNKQLHTAISVFNEGPKICEEHWDVQSASSGNPDIPNVVFSQSLMAASIFREVLCCFDKMLNLPDLCSQLNLPVLIDLLAAFQPSKIQDDTFSGICPSLLPGDIDYLFRGAYLFLEDILDIAYSFSLSLASSVLASLESLLNSIQLFLDQSLESNGKSVRGKFNEGLLPVLRNRLGASACKLLSHDWGTENHENEQKSKAEIIQKTLRIYLKNNESTSELLDVLASSILAKDPYKTKTTQEQDFHDFPMLRSATFIIWYRVLHEENLEILKTLLKRVGQLEKSRAEIESETVKEVLIKLRKSVNVVVSLVHMCKTHDKVIVHATAVKYGGKFVDSFLKAFNFLQANFEAHNDIILQMVKELQKATRTIQIVCSEAKGLKRTMITSKIPTTKRSMERFLFHVKALLHNTSNGETFWMGNLKHKDLLGQVVSSQVYANGDNTGSEDVNANAEEDNHMEAENECEVVSSGQGSDEAN